ncbi:putative entry exclusion protein TrbK-alt [Sinorhizobium meliloti]|uniref:putative entry exclusion protein TrbK-alt n=1 Tax=Rhizobium meliloti TaxID=382 RepID=UPI000AB9B611|nr:putative entry exclusion protein TrbK-alt [Sinorhizobium meliloti]RVO59192.1 conjugal transfer protein TrbK [Sinorhizobium meliloti]
MDGKLLARIGAIAFVAIAITATAIELTREEKDDARPSAAPAVAAAADPHRAELIRCQRLGEAGPRDAACLRAWAESRERFLALGGRPMARLPEAPEARPEAPAQDAAIDDPVRKEMAPQLDGAR